MHHKVGKRMPLTIVRTIRARDQLLVTPLEREPSLQIILLRRRQIQRARNDAHDPIRNAQALIERLRVGDHRVEHLPRLLRRGDAELLDLLELVDAEDAPHVAPGGAGFFAETGRVAGILDGKLGVGGFEPFVGVEGGDGLFGGGDEVFFVFAGDDLVFGWLTNEERGEEREDTHLVKLLVELVKLGSLGHLILVHHERRLDLLVSAFTEEVKAISDQCLVEIDTVIREVVSSVARNFCACGWGYERPKPDELLE